ncbi:cation:proton antiporter [Acinetobacter baumannii]|uniref:cation:proton antiporter n=1 Tax=Acinetobacter baumannii TaxID=470 RepID=UPI001E588572|nr:cation:proton antiporter [Acinetobacter baumannii]MDC5645977.1 cation:proton antiporter [Acinetobacter baumannii]MDO7490448.1 cation:proton antiporter [Acinetobacter baumannii]UDY21925.1 Na(+)/H(+)-K(+) antiporter GerN [Acinetobacter baumannii]
MESVKGVNASAVSASAEVITTDFFIELMVILLVSRIIAWIAQRFLGQTKSVGEIIAGIMLGPSVFGLFFPNAFASFFNPDVSIIFTAISQFGLLLLMFHMGLEFDISSEFKARKKTIISISTLGIALPFSLGVASAGWFWSRIHEAPPDRLSFALFMGVAMSITAIPILGRIFMEMGLEKTRIASVTIGAAIIDDMLGWILLGIVSALAVSNLDILSFSVKILLLAIYIFCIIVFLGPFVRKNIDRYIQKKKGLDVTLTSVLIILLLLSSMVTSRLGVFSIAGGIILGIALKKSELLHKEWKEKISPLVYTIFLPIFFTYTGLRTDIGSLQSVSDLWALLFICAIAFSGKFVGGYLAALFSGEKHRDALVIGVCMNTRALMELIVINVAYDLGVLPKEIFTMLVLMALISTFITTPVIRLLLRKRLVLNQVSTIF